MKAVEGTDVKHCDTCGTTTGVVEPQRCPHGKTADQPCGDCLADEGLDKPEVVTGALEVRSGATERAKAELGAATHEALMGVEPIPSRDQFLTMAATANMLSQSTAAPPAMRNPYVAFHVCMMGRALNLDPATAMNLIDAVGYDKNKRDEDQTIQLSLSPELLVARVEMMGLGSVELLWATKTRASAVALLPGGRVVRATKNQSNVKIGDIVEILGEKGRVEFDWDMAEEAELTDDRCVWDSEMDVVTHWRKPGSSGRGWSNGSPNGCRCGSYKKYPGRMMGWRAMGFCVHTYFAQASLGLYSPEELGAVVDDNGRAIDPMTVDLPEGYTSAGTTNTPNEGGAPADDAASDEQIADIRWRVSVLPEAQRQEFFNRWGDKVREGRLSPVRELLGRQVALGTALLQGQESIAVKDGWKQPEYPDDVVATMAKVDADRTAAKEGAQAPPGPADAAPGTDAPTTEPEGDTAAQQPPEGKVEPPPVEQAQLAKEAGSIEPPERAPGERTEVQRLRALSDQLGQALAVVTDGIQDRAAAIVKAMTVRQLNAELRERALAVEKVDENQRRYNLAVAISKELAEVDWREANGVPAPSDDEDQDGEA
jgi:hypothetical protein